MKQRKQPTRWFSSQQEKTVAKAIGGVVQSNSGATPFHKGDIKTEKFLIEAKTVTTEQKSFTIKQEWIKKNKEEAFAMHRPYSALAFQFGPGEPNYYIIDEKLFKLLLGALQDD